MGITPAGTRVLRPVPPQGEGRILRSQGHLTYVCFGFTEQTGKGQFQYYQVWAWDDEVSRLMQLGVKKESRLWITGTQRLVAGSFGEPGHSPHVQMQKSVP